MKNWLERFYSTKISIDFNLNGIPFKKSDCIEVALGVEKNLYKIKETNLYFLIPRDSCYPNKLWDNRIRVEKSILDRMTELEWKTLQFNIEPIEIHESCKPTYSINVLVTKDFATPCPKECFEINDYKSTKTIGTPPDMIGLKNHLIDKLSLLKML